MSDPSASPNQDQTIDDSNLKEPDVDNLDSLFQSEHQPQPQPQPQISEPLIPENLELIPQKEETSEVILEENPNQETAAADNSSSLPAAADTTGVSVPDPSPLMSPSNTHKRIKRKCSTRKLQAIVKKVQTLKENLKPVPFCPSLCLDFARHDKLLKRLGLWEFVHIEFDRDLRVDLIAQLIGNYDPKLRGSYVNDFKIAVNRADLARAFKLPLPVKKDKGGSAPVVDALDLDNELSEDSIRFLENVVSFWMLLHEDTWIMPNEVVNWTKAIKDGHPEKVDWASMFWFMVEKELTQGNQLVDCYYAAHLQYLMKSQREELFSEEPEKVESEVDAKELAKEEDINLVNEDNAKVGDSNEAQEEDAKCLDDGPNIELTLGQDLGENQDVKDIEMMDVEEHKEEEKGEEEKQWPSDEGNDANVPLLQRCKMQEPVALDNNEEKKEDHEMAGDDGDDVEEEAADEGAETHDVEDGFDVMPSDDTLVGDGLTGNLLQSMETTQIAFSSQVQLHDQSSVELLASGSEMHTASPFFGSGIKRENEFEHDMAHHYLNGSNKRLRIEGAWDQKPLEFGSCMEQMQQLMTRAREMYEAKEQNEEQINLNQQVLLNEMHKRDSVIDHLQKSRCKEIEERDGEIFRLERELAIMGKILDGYRKALKETQKQFSEYRKKFQLPEEPYYKDAGPGGLMLSTAEIERQRLKQEEENRSNCLFFAQKVKDMEEELARQFEGFWDKVHMLDKRLMNLDDDVKNFKNFRAKRGVLESEDKVSETPDYSPNE